MKNILITGATDGIGKLTAIDLAKQNHRLLIHGRNEQKLKKVKEEIISKADNPQVEIFTADLSALAEVRQLAEDVLAKHDSLDILINNAGVGFADHRYGKDGTELRLAVNYLAPFLLTQLLIPALKKGAPSRIVNVSSAGQRAVNFEDIMMEKNFDGTAAYSQSKLALIMFSIDLAEKLKNDNITVNSLHPGTFLDTNMVREAGIPPMGKPESGADAVTFLATSAELNGVTGKYFNVKKEAMANTQAYDEKVREKLWNMSMDLTGLNK